MASPFPNIVADRLSDSAIPAYEQPAANNYVTRILSWAHEALAEGDAFLKSQPGLQDMDAAMKAVTRRRDPGFSSKLSSTQVNILGKVERDLAALLTDTKPFWNYTTSLSMLTRAAEVANKLAEIWWNTNLIDRRFTDLHHYVACCGTGFLHQFYDRTTEDISVTACDPRDVIPVRPLNMEDIQGAFAVIHKRKVTANYLKALFPAAAHLISPDPPASSSSSHQGRASRFSALQASIYWRSQMDEAKKQIPGTPGRPLYTIYVRDPAVNRTDGPVLMGDKGTNWSYTVDPNRPLYPNLRVIMFTDELVFYDGPYWCWHGGSSVRYPFIKFTLDPLPWTWLGSAPMWEILPLQQAFDKQVRIIEDHADNVAEPPVAFPKDSSRQFQRKYTTRTPGQKYTYDPRMTQGRNPVALDRPPNLDPVVPAYIQSLERWMHEISGVVGMAQLAALNQAPLTGISQEQMLQALSPTNRLRSRSIEASLRQFASLTLFNMMQWYSTAKRMAMLGERGLLGPEEGQFSSASLVPDFPFEEDYESPGVLKPGVTEAGAAPPYSRALHIIPRIAIQIEPGSLLDAAKLTKKLMAMQDRRAGSLDIWTYGEVMGWDVGDPPPFPPGHPLEGKVPKTVPERLMMEALLGLSANVSPTGRKASAQGPPRPAMKDGGARLTIREDIPIQ